MAAPRDHLGQLRMICLSLIGYHFVCQCSHKGSVPSRNPSLKGKRASRLSRPLQSAPGGRLLHGDGHREGLQQGAGCLLHRPSPTLATPMHRDHPRALFVPAIIASREPYPRTDLPQSETCCGLSFLNSQSQTPEAYCHHETVRGSRRDMWMTMA